MGVANVLARIMSENNYRRADIAKLSGVPYTTIRSIFDLNDDNIKLSTLRKLSIGLNISLNELAGLPPAERTIAYEERLLLEKYRTLTPTNKIAAESVIDGLVMAQKKDGTSPLLKEG